MITTRKKNSDSQDKYQKTISSVFGKEHFSIKAKDVTGNFKCYNEHLRYVISKKKNQTEKQRLDKECQIGDTNRIERVVTSKGQPDTSLNEVDSKAAGKIANNQEKIVFHDKQQSTDKQSQMGNVNKVETVVSLRDHPAPNEIHSKINDKIKALLLENFKNEGIKTQNEEIANHLTVQLNLSNKEGMERCVSNIKYNELTSWNTKDGFSDNYNPTKDEIVISLVCYMPTYKFKELCPLVKVSSEREAKYDYSDIEDQFTYNLLSYFVNCIDPGPPDKTIKTSSKPQSEKNEIKEHNQNEIISFPATKRAEVQTQVHFGPPDTIIKTSSKPQSEKNDIKEHIQSELISSPATKLAEAQTLHMMHTIDNSAKLPEINPIIKTSQTTADSEVILPNNEQNPNPKPINTGAPLPSLPKPNKQKDEIFDMSKGFPQQISWGKPGNEKGQQPNLCSTFTPNIQNPQHKVLNPHGTPDTNLILENTQRSDWTMWEHPLVPMPNNREEFSFFESDKMSNRSNESQVCTTPTATAPQVTQKNNLNDLSAPSQPNHFKWYAQITPQTNENNSTFQTDMRQYPPSYNMYQNYYCYPNQMHNVHTEYRPVATQLPNTPNAEDSVTRNDIEHGRIWVHDAYPSSSNMNTHNPIRMQQPLSNTNRPKKNLTNLIQPGCTRDSLQFQQHLSQNTNPDNSRQFLQKNSCSEQNQQSYHNFTTPMSPQFQQEISRNVKSEPNQKLNSESHGSSQLQQKCVQSAPDSKIAEDVPLSQIISMVRLRVSNALKRLSAEEQIKSLKVSNKFDDKNPIKSSPKRSESNLSPPRNYYSQVYPPYPAGKKNPDRFSKPRDSSETKR